MAPRRSRREARMFFLIVFASLLLMAITTAILGAGKMLGIWLAFSIGWTGWIIVWGAVKAHKGE
jgi:hypothetical protein